MTDRGTASLGGAPVFAVLFDYGNTLITFERPDAALAEAYRLIAQRLREAALNPPAPEVLLRGVHDRVEAEVDAHVRSGSLEEIDLVAAARRAYADLGLTPEADLLDELLRVEQEAWWEGVIVDPQAIPTLDKLRRRGLRVGLCSNAPWRARSLHEQLAHFGIANHLDSVTFSAEIGWRKPSPRIFQAALAALDASAEDTVMVGDSRDDIAGARAVGMRAILVSRRPDAREGAPLDGVFATVHELRELVPVLFGTGTYTGH